MTALTPVERHERRRQQRRRELIRWSIRTLVVLLGQALHDNPKTGQTITVDRTLHIPTENPASTANP
ncbi:MAG: hypothetical protein E6G33_02620 [Actinobacteria bacterium]|nr:MAG: hypothetical protein E6G33_02620 [Actinomycetota bacterium]